MPSLRVAHITASSSVGGGPEHVWQLLCHLPSTLTELYLAAPTKSPYGLKFITKLGDEHCFELPERQWSTIAFIKLVFWLRKHHIQIIHSHGRGAGIYGRFASLLTNIPCIHTFHGIHIPSTRLSRLLYLGLEHTLRYITRASIAVSPSEASEAMKLGFTDSIVIPNGVECVQRTFNEIKKIPFTIVHASRFDPIKNSEALLHIALILRNMGCLSLCRFVVLGDGERKTALEQAIYEHNLSDYFEFVGFAPNIRPYLQNAGCYLTTSLREGMPLAVLEAQAEGVPVVASRVPGNIDAVAEDITGLLFSVGDTYAAAKQIYRLIEDNDLHKRLSIAARLYIEKHNNIKEMAKKTYELYAIVTSH